MVTHPNARRKGVLEQIARRAMQAYGFLPDFSADALRELGGVQQMDRVAESSGLDLRHLLWASIDNVDSLDLEQLTVAQALTDTQVTGESLGGRCRRGGPRQAEISHRCARPPQHDVGLHRRQDLSHAAGEAVHGSHLSLNYHKDRPAVVIEMMIGDGGVMQSSNIYRAWRAQPGQARL